MRVPEYKERNLMKRSIQTSPGRSQFLPLWESHYVVHNSAAGRVSWLAAVHKEPRVDPLADNHAGELG